jgi:hypothetical protein
MFPGSVVLAIAWKRKALLPGAAQDYRDHFVSLFTPHGRIGGAGRRIAREKQHDPGLLNELCGPASPCSNRGECGGHANSEGNRQEVASDGARSER